MAKGGYRWNAGRPGWHIKAEHCLRIDARRWSREGMFSAGRAGAWVWRDAESGEEKSRIGYCGEGGAVALNFTVNGEPVRQQITTQRTACNYGGSRVWFSCPRCSRRVAVLFLRGAAGFICRHCGRIAYSSQSEDEVGRLWRKQRNAEARLLRGWARPKGMHQSTRDALVKTIIECETRRDDALSDFIARHYLAGR
jgi:hypothetical protein